MKHLKAHLLVIGSILVSLSPHAGATCLDLHLGETEKGSISAAAQTNCYSFTANAGEVLDFTTVTTSGDLVPQLQLYNSEGTLIASAYAGEPGNCGGNALEMNQIKLATAGTYYLDISDCSATNTGDYDLYAQSTNDPVRAVRLPLASVQSGKISSAAQSKTYTFSANANDILDFTIATTSGNFIPKISLYNPDGTVNSSNYAGNPGNCGGTTLEMDTVTLPTTGTYAVLIADCSDTNPGQYDVYVQRTDRPSGATLVFGQVQMGSITSEAQSDTYTFKADAGDVFNFTMVTVSRDLVPKMRLYDPEGNFIASNYAGNPGNCGGSDLEMNGVIFRRLAFTPCSSATAPTRTRASTTSTHSALVIRQGR